MNEMECMRYYEKCIFIAETDLMNKNLKKLFYLIGIDP